MTSALRSVELRLPLRLTSTLNTREHWSKRAKRSAQQRGAVRLVLAAACSPQLRLPVVVEIVRIGARELDGDNLQGAAKAVRDGIADALGADDGDAAITWLYGQRRGRPREYACEIKLAEVAS